jgi:hypothetical protein
MCNCNVTLMLADYACVASQKLTAVGAGWTVTGPIPTPSALAALIDVPWTETNTPHHVSFSLTDADGAPVLNHDGQPIRVETDFEVGRPPGVPAGTSIPVPLAVNVGPIPLRPGSRYVWEFTLDGDSKEGWRLPFFTRTAAGGTHQAA